MHFSYFLDTLAFGEAGSGQDNSGSVNSRNTKLKHEQQQRYQTLDIFSSLLDDSETSQDWKYGPYALLRICKNTAYRLKPNNIFLHKDELQEPSRRLVLSVQEIIIGT